MKKAFKLFLIVFLIFPMMIFVEGCSCSGGENDDSGLSDNTYTVMFYTGSGNTFNIPSQEVPAGGLVTQPKRPSTYFGQENGVTYIYSFNGWCEDSACTDLWKFESDKVNRDMTLYARWDKNPQ